MSKTHRTRRAFLRSSAALTAGASTFAIPAVVQGRLGAAARIRIAVVGVRGRGRSHVRSIEELAEENVEVAAVCDVDEKVLNSVATSCERASGRRPATYVDYRKMLEDKTLDAVSLATPDHWHALQTIWACQAGKDVYCEKVAAHNIAEGRKMVEAAAQYKRIVQHGTQARSSPYVREGIRKLHEGVIGRVYMGRAIAHKYRAGGKNEFQPVPDGLDWDTWLGPAKEMPYNRLVHRRWRFIKEIGNGQIGAQGVHQLDMLRWGLELDRHPDKVQSMGGNFCRTTSDETIPGEMSTSFVFEDEQIMITFETRIGYTNAEAGMGDRYPWCNYRDAVGAIFFGTDGYMILPNFSSYYTFLGRSREPGPFAEVDPKKAPMMNTEHFQNWIAAMRSRNVGDLNSDIEQGHYASTMCYLGNIAYETGRTLHFDSASERFINDHQANEYAAPEYRRPFVLPDEV